MSSRAQVPVRLASLAQDRLSTEVEGSASSHCSQEKTSSSKPLIGVLALQGDVVEHLAALERAGADAIAVKTREQLGGIDGLIIPGGESTTVMKLLQRFGMDRIIVERVRDGMPLWGTCMGMIVAAHDVAGLDQPTLDLLDVTVRRNAFGRQNNSAEVDLNIPAIGLPRFPAVFIRSPWIERIGPDVEMLAERDGHGVMVRQGNVLGTAFHPELTGDPRIHRYFLSMVEEARQGKGTSAA